MPGRRAITKSGTRPSRARRAAWLAALLPAALPLWWYTASPTAVIRVDGIAVPAGGDAEAALTAQSDAWLDTPVTLDAGRVVVHRSRRELGASIDPQRAAREARGGGPLLAALGLAEPVSEAAWTVRVDDGRLRAELEQIRARMDRESTGDRERDVLSLIPAMEAAREAIVHGDVYVTLPTTTIALPDAVPGHVEHGFEALLAAYETDYARVADGRRQNIELAAELIDGWVVAPGESFSFNHVVGAREVGRGFRRASEIQNGEVVDGVGGGICQTAGTLHAAAFLAGLPIEEHHVHSRQSGYIDLGLDAMVAWPSHDLRFRNDYAFPIRLAARADGRVVHVEVRGAEALRSVTHRTRVVSRIDRGERRIRDAHLARGAERVEREGEDGLVVERIRVIRTPTGVTTDTTELRYPPVDRIVHVGR